MAKIRLCRCGKCKVVCYLHGKKAKCGNCGKLAKLGTEISKGGIRYICNDCCKLLQDKANKDEEARVNAALDNMRKESLKKCPMRRRKRGGRYGDMGD